MCFHAVAHGAYEATYKKPGGTAVSLGLAKEVFKITSTPEIEDRTVDQYGKTIVGGVYLGQNAGIAMVLSETVRSVLDAIYPFSTATNGTLGSHTRTPGIAGSVGIVGSCAEDYAGAITLTAIDYAGDDTGTGAYKYGPRSIIIPKALAIREIELSFGNVDRMYAILFRIYPTIVQGIPYHYSMSGDGVSNANFPSTAYLTA